MSRADIEKKLINLAPSLHSQDDDPLEVACATRQGDSLQVASDRLGLCVMVTATEGGIGGPELDICLSRKDAIRVACSILAHAGGLPE